MALGTQSVLGISSNLTWDVIEQMKDNDVKNQIDPITKKIETNIEKQTELTELTTLMTSLNSNFKNLSDFSTYQKRSATVEGNGVKATAGEGLAIQDIKINVSQLAQNDVNQVGKKFAERDSVFTNKNTSIDFYYNGANYSVDIKAGSTLAEVSQAITDATDGNVIGVIMNTGGDEPYQLMIQSTKTGANQKVYFGSTLESAAMPGGKIVGGKLDIEIGGKSISVDLDQIGSEHKNEAADNAQLVLDAILDEIKSNQSLADVQSKIDSGEITIKLSNDGKGLMFNDAKGGVIKVTPQNVKTEAYQGQTPTDSDLGFTKKEVGASNPLVTGSTAVKEGSLTGTISIAGVDIDLANLTGNGTTNAEKLVDTINNDATLRTKVEAKVEDGKLVLNSLDNQDIIITAQGDEVAKNEALASIGLSAGTYASSKGFLNELDIKNIQSAQNAKFTYQGIPIERETNSFDDVVSGLSLELTAVTEKDKDVIVRIARDDEGLAEEMEDFVKNYNEVYNKIQELVKYDEETELAGVFNGNSEVRSILRQLNSIITSNDVNGKNLVGYGIYMNEDGTLKFEKETFESAYNSDPEAAISFFRSTTSVVRGESIEVDGIFTKLRNTMDGLITGSNSTLKLLETSLIDEQKTLNDDKTSTQDYIDMRYETMASKWSAYDQLIAKTQQSASTITQMIQQSMNN